MVLRPLRTGFGALALLLSATAGSAQGVLMRGNDTDPATLDHHKTSTIAEANVIRDLYEGLVTEDAAGELIPGVAESWEISEDGLTYTFHLRENAKWSNGDPVTSDDFLFAFRRIMTPGDGGGLREHPVPDPERRGDHQGRDAARGARRRRARPADAGHHAELADALLPAAAPAPDRQPDAPGVASRSSAPTTPSRATWSRTAPTCSKASCRTTRSSCRRTRTTTTPRTCRSTTINWIPFEDRSACLRRFEAGEVHICSDVPAEQMAYMKEKLPDQLRIAPYLGTYYVRGEGREGDASATRGCGRRSRC